MFTDKFEKLELELHGVRLPEIVLSDEDYKNAGVKPGISNLDFLKQICKNGFEHKLEEGKIKEEDRAKYRERFKTEIDVLVEGGFVDYVLLVWDIINFCIKEKVPKGAARGCFTPETRVKMADKSFKLIKDINPKDLIIDAYGEKQEVIEKFIYNINEEIVELELESGEVIKCTKDHKFLTQNRGWVEARNLTENDELTEV